MHWTSVSFRLFPHIIKHHPLVWWIANNPVTQLLLCLAGQTLHPHHCIISSIRLLSPTVTGKLGHLPFGRHTAMRAARARQAVSSSENASIYIFPKCTVSTAKWVHRMMANYYANVKTERNKHNCYQYFIYKKKAIWNCFSNLSPIVDNCSPHSMFTIYTL